MKRLFWILPVGIVGLAALLLLGPFVVGWLWSWLIPDLFPAAVEQGFVAAEISWWTGFKLIIVLAIMGGIVAKK